MGRHSERHHSHRDHHHHHRKRSHRSRSPDRKRSHRSRSPDSDRRVRSRHESKSSHRRSLSPPPPSKPSPVPQPQIPSPQIPMPSITPSPPPPAASPPLPSAPSAAPPLMPEHIQAKLTQYMAKLAATKSADPITPLPIPGAIPRPNVPVPAPSGARNPGPATLAAQAEGLRRQQEAQQAAERIAQAMKLISQGQAGLSKSIQQQIQTVPSLLNQKRQEGRFVPPPLVIKDGVAVDEHGTPLQVNAPPKEFKVNISRQRSLSLQSNALLSNATAGGSIGTGHSSIAKQGAARLTHPTGAGSGSGSVRVGAGGVMSMALLAATSHMKPETAAAAAAAAAAGPEEKARSEFLDRRIETGKSVRSRKGIRFVEEGRYAKKAEKMRNRILTQQAEELLAQQIKHVEEAETLTMRTKGPCPTVEWWDRVFLKPQGTYVDLGEDTQAFAFPENVITNKVQHPVPAAPLAEPPPPPPMQFMLTPKERKQQRHRARMARAKEAQDMVRCGLLPAPPPKVKLGNMMRVLKDDAVQDPTQIEKMVRGQVASRQEAHDARNQERKLTPEERREKERQKKIIKLRERGSTVEVAVFRVNDLRHPKHRYKVETNAQQLGLTGVCVLHGESNIVVAEGLPEKLRKFVRLMLHRINWGLPLPESPEVSREQNTCEMVWRGDARRPAFRGFRIECVNSKNAGRNVLAKAGVEQYWDTMVQYKADVED